MSRYNLLQPGWFRSPLETRQGGKRPQSTPPPSAFGPLLSRDSHFGLLRRIIFARGALLCRTRNKLFQSI
jgi:hypothetical protein